MWSLVFSFFVAAWSTNYEGIIQKCHDGDTCHLQVEGQKKPLKLRFAGIDAPETKQNFGKASKKALEDLILKKKVKAVCEGTSFDRSVCTVFLGDLDVNREMVRLGWAMESPKYSKGKFKKEQSEARDAKLGIWKGMTESPHCYRSKKKGPCAKNAFHMP